MTARSDGYALVSVLWLIVLLTSVTAAYHAHARVEARQLATSLHRAKAEGLAEAGIWLAVQSRFAALGMAPDSSSRTTRTFEIDGTTVAVTIADVSGLININNAQTELLAALFAARSGLGPAQQASIVDAILDWRDEDSEKRPDGAEDVDYAHADRPHGAKDAPFATIDELLLVRGMTPAAFRALAPALTVLGNHGRVNVAAAPPEVLAALPRDSGGSSDTYDQRFVQQTGEGIYAVSALATVNDVRVQIDAAVRHARGEEPPVQLLAWSDSPAKDATAEDLQHAP